MNDIVLEIPWLLPTLFWATGLAIGYAIHAIGVRIAKQTVDAHAATTEARAKHEAEVIGAYLNRDADTICVLQDIFWALLNSNEFVLNR